MTRIYKHYDFPLRLLANTDDRVPAQHVHFSSYPAALCSTDDWLNKVFF
jgi:hypothetical protein